MGAAASVKNPDGKKKQDGEATRPSALRRVTKHLVDNGKARLKQLVRSFTTARSVEDEWVFEDEEDDTSEDKERMERKEDLATGYKRLMAYAASGTVAQKKKVAEMLANHAVQPIRQREIVELGGLKLLLPLTKSEDSEVQRLAAHALANISVDATNQILLAENGGIEMLVSLLESGKGTCMIIYWRTYSLYLKHTHTHRYTREETICKGFGKYQREC